MKTPVLTLLLPLLLGSIACTVTTKRIREVDYPLHTRNAPYEFSKWQVASGRQTKILTVDFKRLLNRQVGVIDSPQWTYPVTLDSSRYLPQRYNAGYSYFGAGAYNQAIYNLISENPEYDVIAQPLFEVKRFVVPLFYARTTVTLKARLGKWQGDQ